MKGKCPGPKDINLRDYIEESNPIIYPVTETNAIDAKVLVAFIAGKDWRNL